MLSARKRERIVRWGAWFVLLAALLPNISYMGHWPITSADGSDEHAHGVERPAGHDSESDAHVAHCHAGPKSCGGGESTVGTPVIGENDEDAAAIPGTEDGIDRSLRHVRADGYPVVDPRPPRHL
jgi:hypothetical protein